MNRLTKQDDRIGPHPYWVYTLVWVICPLIIIVTSLILWLT